MRDGYGRIARNTVFLVGGRFLSRLVQFFLFIYAARRLGAAEFGIFSFGYATVAILAIAMDLGISVYLVQQVSRDTRRLTAYMAKAIFAKCLIIGPALLLIMATGWVLEKDARTLQVLFILGIGTICDSLTGVFYGAFEAHEEMAYPAIVIAVSNLVMSATGILLIYFYPDLLLLCLVFTGGALMRLAFASTWCMGRYGMPDWKATWPGVQHMIRSGLPFALVTIFISIYYYIDTVILSMFRSEAVVGLYNAAYRLLEAPLFVIQAFTTALFPAASRMYASDPAELRAILARMVKIAGGLGIFVAVVTILIADPLIGLIYGPAYAAAAPLLMVLILSVAIIMPNTVCGTALRAVGKQSASAWATGFGALLNIALNFILIPHYGAVGAAWTTVSTEGFIFVLYYVMIRRYLYLT